ncbi:MAG: type II toxin-antitoxin system RelE/ParE family toxin [Candidatus Levybacteria bacterium]|nr:type II toxin-antitoxin system RelE/ParE family toxin [Candidatus Levybacteria bacterium]
MLRLKLTTRAKKELKNISYRHRLALSNIFEDIKENPDIGKPLTRELTGKYSYKIGVYRIVYKVNKKDKIILILTAGHRSTIYK